MCEFFVRKELIKLKYEVIDNQKEEWVVFVHGIGGSTKTWGKQIDEFSENYNLLHRKLENLQPAGAGSPEIQ